MRKPLKSTRIMVFGTFDILHPGHEHFFRQARRLSRQPFLIVSIARDANVKRIKGHRPQYDELTRRKHLKNKTLVDKTVLGNPRGYLTHIIKERPNIIALGYDQKAYTKGLKGALAKRGLKVKVVRLKPYQPHRYKSSLYKRLV